MVGYSIGIQNQTRISGVPFFCPFYGCIRLPLFCIDQLVDKDPDKAIALFWAAINAGDRVDSALKDMAIVMKQQNRAEEAIEAIKSLRGRCSDQAQESLDNILLDLYKVLFSPFPFLDEEITRLSWIGSAPEIVIVGHAFLLIYEWEMTHILFHQMKQTIEFIR